MHKQFAKTNSDIQNQYKIINELNLLLNNNKNQIIHKIIKAQSKYYGVHKATYAIYDSFNKLIRLPNWQAVITINKKRILNKYFRYTEAGKILAAEAVNKKLIEIYGNNYYKLNQIDYSKCTFKELQQEYLFMLKTSQYIGVSKYIKKYILSNKNIIYKLYWRAEYTLNNKTKTKLFTFTQQGEILAAQWYNLQNKHDINIINEKKCYSNYLYDYIQYFEINFIARNSINNNIGLQELIYNINPKNRKPYILHYWKAKLIDDNNNILLNKKYAYIFLGEQEAKKDINIILDNLGLYQLKYIILLK